MTEGEPEINSSAERRITSPESRLEYQAIQALIRDGLCTVKELRVILKEGSFTVEQQKSLALLLAEELEKKAIIDPLTGLLNRAQLEPKFNALQERLNHNEEEGNLEVQSVMIIFGDIKSFKTLNDTHGHITGDRVLVAIAEHLRESTKKRKDTLFRVGGDEFIAILSINNNNPRTLEAIFQRIKDQMNADLSVVNADGVDISFKISMGYSVLHKGNNTTAEELLHSADKKMYEDKTNGNEEQ